MPSPDVAETSVIEPEALEALVTGLAARGYRVLGPTVRDGAIVYDDLDSADELPIGWTDDQEPGSYRLERRDDDARFGYAVGPHSWKQFLFPPRVRLWQARRTRGRRLRGRGRAARRRRRSPSSASARATSTRSRSRTASSSAGAYVDRDYAARREDAFVVAVNCFEPGGTCFCVSMGTGPDARRRVRPRAHRDPRRRAPASRRGRQRRGRRAARRARRAGRRPTADLDAAERSRRRRRANGWAAAMDTDGPPRAPRRHPRAPALGRRRRRAASRAATARWSARPASARRVEDATDLTGERRRALARVWDSCFSLDHSYIHGGSVRPSGTLALPAVADPQARHLARPVRHLRLRRLRPLHHLVPGRRSTSPRRSPRSARRRSESDADA